MKMRKRREWFMIFLILPMVSAQYDLKNDLYGAERISFNPVPPPVVRQPPPPPPQHQGNARGYQAPPHAAFFQPPRSYSNSYLTNNYVPSNVQRPSGFRPPLLQPHSSANFAPPKHNLPHLNMIPEVFNDWRMAQLHEQHPQRFTNLANHDVHQQSNVLKQIRKSSEAVRRPVFTNAKPEYQESDLTPNHYVSDSSILSSTPSTQPTTTTSATTTTSKRASVVYESDFYNDRRIPSSPPASQPTQTSFETPYQASETATRKVSTVSHSNYPAQTTSRKPYIEPESYSRTDDYEASPIYQTTGAFDSKRVSTQYLSTSTRYPSYETENTQFKARVTTTNALRTAIGVRVPVQNPKTIAHSEPASYDGSQSYNNQVITNTLQQTTQQPTERYTQKTPSSNSRPSISLSEGTQALVSISQKQVNNRAGPPAPPPVRNNGNSWTTTKAPNSPIVVGTRVGQNRNHQNLGSSNTISNANEVNNIIVHIFLNAKDNKHPGAHASTKLGPFHGTFGVGTSHGGPGTNANPIVITKDFDRDRLRFIDSQTAENMMESGPTNIVEVKAMVSSPDQQIGSTLNRAVSTELDRAIPVVLNRFKGPASGMDGELRKELEQALVDEIAKNLGQTIDDISTDVTEDDLTQLIEEGLKEFESEKNEAPTSTSLPTVSSSITEETPSFTTTTRIIVTTSAPALTSTTRRIVTTTTHTTTTPTTTTSKPTPTTTTTTTRVPTTTESTTTTTTTVSSTTQTKPTTTTRSTTTTTVPTTTTTTMTRLQPVTTTSSVPRTSSALPSKPQSTTTEPKKATIDFDMENEVGVHNVDSAQPKQELEPMTKSKEEPTPPTDIDDDYDSTETDIVHNPEDDVDELPSDGQRTTQSELRTTSTIAESALENADASRASSARTTIQTASTASTTPSLNLLPPATTSQENINNSDEIFETSHQPKLSIVDLSEPDDDTELTSHSTQSTATGHTRADLITLTASTMSMEDIPLKTSTTPPITKNTVVPPDETSPFDANSDTFKINETASKASPAIQTSTSKINVVDSSSEEVLAHMPDLTKPIIDEPSSSEAEHEPFKHNMPFEPSQATDSAQAPENSEKENFEMFETTTLTNGGDVQMQPESVVFPQGQCPTPNNLKDQNRTDVLFLLDSSNSFDEDKFMHAITLILHTVDYFQNIGPDGVQFSLVQYNSEPYLEFSLRKHNCKQWLLDDIADTEYMTGKSMLGKALDKVSKFAFTKKRGDRLDAENVLIILTGGESDDRVQQPVKIAKQNNMTVLVIATLETDPSYLLNLAGDTENVFQLDDSPNAPLAGKLAERIKASSTNGKNTVAVSDNIDQMEIHQPVKPVDINDLSDEKDEVTVTSQPILVNKESNEDRLIKMECAPDGFQIDLNLPASFLGHVVVKGQEKKENCRKVILPLAHNSGNQTVSFFVANEDCEVQQVKSTKPEGMNSTMVLHLVHDPSLRTDKDRAYLLQCFVGTGETSEAEVSTNLDVLKNDITIAETISLSSVPPTCSYSIRKNSPDGPTISKATVGQTVYHRWECDGGDEANHVYGIQVHNCYASDDIEQKYPIVDNRGCSSDLAVLSDPFYEDEKLVAFAVSHAFGFKDTESLKFVCKLSLCTRDGDGCEGVTPPVCGKSQNQSDLLLTRRSRHQYSAIEKALTSALSTEVDLTTRGAEIRDRITGLATSHITLGVTALLIVALIVTGVVSKLYSPRSRVSSSSFSTADDESEIGFSPASSPQLTLRLPAGNSSSSVEPAADPRLVEFLRDFDRQRYV